MTKKPLSTKPVAAWLFFTAFSVFLMAVIGAITRLTESGLSITEWRPVTGALPPLNEADWLREFDLYRQSPQGATVNAGMELADFKKIYFWEWVHRFWGRMIGIIYFLPLLYFWRRLPAPSRPAFIGLLLLGALQGGMGWFMVMSGLVDMPAVSHYRLAAHLMIAFAIYAWLFRLGLAFSLKPAGDAGKISDMRGMVKGALALSLVTMTWGAFTAGLDAGLIYNTFPTMDGYWFPPEFLRHDPVYLAPFEDQASVQFTHRILAILLVAKVVFMWQHSRRFHPPARVARLFGFAALMALAQASLGVITLLTGVHIAPAVLHQAGAMVLLALLVWLLHEIPVIVKDKT